MDLAILKPFGKLFTFNGVIVTFTSWVMMDKRYKVFQRLREKIKIRPMTPKMVQAQ